MFVYLIIYVTSAAEVVPLLWKMQLFCLPIRLISKEIVPSLKAIDHGNNNQI